MKLKANSYMKKDLWRSGFLSVLAVMVILTVYLIETKPYLVNLFLKEVK